MQSSKKIARKKIPQQIIDQNRENKILEIIDQRNSMGTCPIPITDDCIALPTN